ncbi:biotin-dependent carboxyltransferase family protein [Streptomyces sp. NPDC004959]|uniref:5-oxoprolinase subunit C family protein n=1 Tax=unclassified Streptomyces TaxID=2593676 RepID=UPI0004C9FE75|nr:biotin-dependent carboxyltransferase family protein [Streptomyces sp. NRRL F-5630]
MTTPPHPPNHPPAPDAEVQAALDVLATGPFATLQDLGRPGLAPIGVGRSGAADRASFALANRLLANPEDAAGIEATLGGLAVRALRPLLVAVTGAPCPVTVDDTPVAFNAPVEVPAGAVLRLGRPVSGLRTYLAVRGGLAVRPVLGSRATDVLSGLGPDPLSPGTALPVGPPPAAHPQVELAPVPDPPEGELTLQVVPGPRADWFTPAALTTLLESDWEVSAQSDRVGMRLTGPALERAEGKGELPSEGMVAGALQVPPSGRPVLFLADHPVTGGYPVIAVVTRADVDRAAQARPGQRLRFATTVGPGHDAHRPRTP